MPQTNSRLLQIIDLVCALFLVVVSWSDSDLISLALGMFIVLVSLYQLLFLPTSEQIMQKVISVLRQLGIYPTEGQGTDEDVKKLVELGHELAAIYLYQEIHNASWKRAVDAVKQLA